VQSADVQQVPGTQAGVRDRPSTEASDTSTPGPASSVGSPWVQLGTTSIATSSAIATLPPTRPRVNVLGAVRQRAVKRLIRRMYSPQKRKLHGIGQKKNLLCISRRRRRARSNFTRWLGVKKTTVTGAFCANPRRARGSRARLFERPSAAGFRHGHAAVKRATAGCSSELATRQPPPSGELVPRLPGRQESREFRRRQPRQVTPASQAPRAAGDGAGASQRRHR
jgi:hypothetical protein